MDMVVDGTFYVLVFEERMIVLCRLLLLLLMTFKHGSKDENRSGYLRGGVKLALCFYIQQPSSFPCCDMYHLGMRFMQSILLKLPRWLTGFAHFEQWDT